jgi:hypothetical protein
MVINMPCRIDAENVSAQVDAVRVQDPATVIQKFVSKDYGWDKIIQQFTTKAKECKERDFCTLNVDETTLAYIGAVRKKIVTNTFSL